MKIIALVVALFSLNAFAGNFCDKLDARPEFLKAVTVVASNMQYSMDELCASERILDLQVTERLVVTREGKEEPHVWVTLHYNEYSCQYFVRDADLVVTQKNCYNTW